MHNVRYVRVSSPRLVRLRKTFRTIIIRAVEEQQSILSPLEMDYLRDFLSTNNFKDGDSFINHEFTQNFETFEEAHVIKEEIINLDNLLKASIYICAFCPDIKGDRVYDPISQAWYCIPCYEEYVKDHLDDEEDEKRYEERVAIDIGLAEEEE